MDNIDTGADVGTGPAPLEKVPSGVAGLDEVTGGGLPRGRPTLVAGGAGCGKTLLAMQFLVHGALEYGEPGVHVAFEETPAELTTNVASLGYDLPRLERERLLWLDHVRLDPVEIIETGEYDLEGLFVRLAAGVDAVGAKRVVLDTIEVLFGALSDTVVIRSELQRLFRWFKERGLTAVITGESGRDGSLTRYGIEEYVSDCVIVLDHRVRDDLSTRRLRVVKYRGSAARHERVPLPHRRPGHHGAARHVARSRPRCAHRPGVERHRPSRRVRRRRVLPGQLDTDRRWRGHR